MMKCPRCGTNNKMPEFSLECTKEWWLSSWHQGKNNGTCFGRPTRGCRKMTAKTNVGHFFRPKTKSGIYTHSESFTSWIFRAGFESVDPKCGGEAQTDGISSHIWTFFQTKGRFLSVIQPNGPKSRATDRQTDMQWQETETETEAEIGRDGQTHRQRTASGMTLKWSIRTSTIISGPQMFDVKRKGQGRAFFFGLE